MAENNSLAYEHAIQAVLHRGNLGCDIFALLAISWGGQNARENDHVQAHSLIQHLGKLRELGLSEF